MDFLTTFYQLSPNDTTLLISTTGLEYAPTKTREHLSSYSCLRFFFQLLVKLSFVSFFIHNSFHHKYFPPIVLCDDLLVWTRNYGIMGVLALISRYSL